MENEPKKAIHWYRLYHSSDTTKPAFIWEYPTPQACLYAMLLLAEYDSYLGRTYHQGIQVFNNLTGEWIEYKGEQNERKW
jgi:hypothetical protein